jgi:hypothetical protein
MVFLREWAKYIDMPSAEDEHFFVIGAMKAGTTSVHEVLATHPDIAMTRTKEPNFFSERFSRGKEWYQSLFNRKARRKGDASPNYSRLHRWPSTVINMRAYAPNAKLIFILRDPIDRIVSHLHHDIHRDRLTLAKVEHALASIDNDYVLTSSYYFQLKQYLGHFSKDNILLLSFEELRDNPVSFFQKITLFLDIAQLSLPERTKYYAAENKYLIKKYDLVRKYLPSRLRGVYHWLFYFLKITYPKPVLSTEIRRTLKDVLSPDVEMLKGITGNDFAEWTTYNSTVWEK